MVLSYTTTECFCNVLLMMRVTCTNHNKMLTALKTENTCIICHIKIRWKWYVCNGTSSNRH